MVAAASHRIVSTFGLNTTKTRKYREIATEKNDEQNDALADWADRVERGGCTTEVFESAAGNATNRELSAVICEPGLASTALVK